MDSLIKTIRTELTEKSDLKTKINSQHFFKEAILCYGIKTPIVQKISKEYFAIIKCKTKKEIFDLCETFWQSGYIEESFIACHWSYFVHKKYEPADFKIFEKWIDKYVSNWASCDTFCNHTMGEFIDMYPEYLAELKYWAKSKNRWMRRAAAVSLIVPGKHGRYLKEIFEIADILLTDTDDMVQKGYGWMLKSASHSCQKEIYDFVMTRKAIMPRTALRYAIEKLPAELKIKAMQK